MNLTDLLRTDEATLCCCFFLQDIGQEVSDISAWMRFLRIEFLPVRADVASRSSRGLNGLKDKWPVY